MPTSSVQFSLQKWYTWWHCTLTMTCSLIFHVPLWVSKNRCKASHTIIDNLVDCILFPCWLLMSTRNEFPELWMRERDNNDVHQSWENDFFTLPVPRRDINTKHIYNDFIVKMATNRSRRHLHHKIVVPTIRLNGVSRLTGVEMWMLIKCRFFLNMK